MLYVWMYVYKHAMLVLSPTNTMFLTCQGADKQA